jgi:dihydrodipicolinate synthase/N-acetylneuraminate lyase
MNTRDFDSPLRGVLPVFQTPFLADEAVDWEVLEGEIAWLLSRGADGVAMAMVSETLRLSEAERREAAERACRAARGRGCVVISVGAESSFVAERFARHAEECGATAVMAIPPVSVAAGEAELLAYYRRILEAISIPVIVQDASGYVGRPMPIPLQARLLDEYGPDRVLYKPEATPLGPNITALLEATGGRARVLEGSGGIALVESHRRGVTGTMPGADLIDAIVALWRALEAGDEATVNCISPPLSALVSLQTGLDGFLAVEKYLLVKQGVFKNTHVRGPVGYTLDEETRREVDRLFELLQAAVANAECGVRNAE